MVRRDSPVSFETAGAAGSVPKKLQEVPTRHYEVDGGYTPRDLGFRSPLLYAVVTVISLAAIVYSALWDTSISSDISARDVAIFAPPMVLFMIPHGAVDVMAASDIYGFASWRDRLRFYGIYIVVMVLYGLLWQVLPLLSLLIFYVMSTYHAGQTDLEYLALPPKAKSLRILSRGLMLIALPLIAMPEYNHPLLIEMVGYDPMLPMFDWLSREAWIALVAGQHLLLMVSDGLAHRVRWREVLKSVILTLLLVLTRPHVGFLAVYLGLWHSLGHILEILAFFRQRGKPMGVLDFYAKVAPGTILTFLGLAGVYVVFKPKVLSLIPLFISTLSIPHCVICNYIYRSGTKGL